MKFTDRGVLLLGLGRFGGGEAAARYLLDEGAHVRICDRSGAATLHDSVDRLAESGDSSRLEWCLGQR